MVAGGAAMGSGIPDPMATHSSIFERLRNHDPRAWDDFVSRYEPMIRGWCRQWFPRETDDMVQEVLLKLVSSLRTFEYDPEKGRFRGWLKTVTNNLMAELKRRRPPPPIDGEFLPDEVQAGTDLWDRLKAMFDLERLAVAKERVRARVKPATWSAYVETAERGRKATEVGRELGLSVGAVHQARHKVIKYLRREIEDLEDPT
jgi:RNA polymerase sigma-70 factor (ECF subfamily)